MFIYFHLTHFCIPFKCFSFTLDIIITARTKSFILHFFPLFSTLQPPTRRHHQRLCCDISNEYHAHSTTKLLVSRKKRFWEFVTMMMHRSRFDVNVHRSCELKVMNISYVHVWSVKMKWKISNYFLPSKSGNFILIHFSDRNMRNMVKWEL